MAARRRKVGVLTFHKCINYGSYWQASCLVEGLRARGHDAELLDHDCARVRRAEASARFNRSFPSERRYASCRNTAGKHASSSMFRLSRSLGSPGLYLHWARASLRFYQALAWGAGPLGKLFDRILGPARA